jgi:hypothetical protein
MKDFFNKDFTPEDLILYVFCLLLVAFCAFYFLNLQELNDKDLLTTHDREMLSDLKIKDADGDDHIKIAFIKAQLLLINKRYEFSTRFARANAFVKYIGFMVGTLLTILGTMIVIRGVRESAITTEIEAAQKARVKFITSSPGIFIVFAGTLIIMSTVLKTSESNLKDDGITYPSDNNFEMIPEIDSAEVNETGKASASANKAAIK